MLNELILRRAREWAAAPDCPVRALLDHIHRAGNLRPPQIEAIMVWMYLKIEGGGKPLWKLFTEGFFTPDVDLERLQISAAARNLLANIEAARALYLFASERNGSKERLPSLAREIRETPESVDYEGVIRSIFYEEDYADYLFSLPMGAGKTFLIAALIHLELYFAVQAPENPAFARNFLVLIPSGLKSSIGPSLRTIEHFDASWVLPEPAASEMHRLIRLDVLDEAKSAKKSNRARNPNAAKVAACAPFEGALGRVFIVNAEKVILNRVPTDPDLFETLEKSEDEKDREENELRNLLGKLPRLGIHIDEVHHAATDDVKLRQVVNRWAASGGVSVYGYSGTPYLKKAETIAAGGTKLKFQQITNTVYHYPLTAAIEEFLKKPRVEVAKKLEPLEIIHRGVKDFYAAYGSTVYADGTCAKLAIYTGRDIARLEDEVRPFLTGTLGIPKDDILVYHGGNKTYPAPDTEAEFRMLDHPSSHKRVILLVQIGKEGWDCRSLTGVILSQTGDSPSNMVLQTSCRCLRQVTPEDDDATAVIWLNEGNARTLNAQLEVEQHTSIEELNQIGRGAKPDEVARHSRMGHLGLPEVPFVQLRVRHTEVTETQADPASALAALAEEVEAKPSTWARAAQIVERALTDDAVKQRALVDATGATAATWGGWQAGLLRAGLGVPTWADLRAHDAVLRRIFAAITTAEGGARRYNDLYRRAEVEASIRLAFHDLRAFHTEAEAVPECASLLAVDVVPPIERHDLLYPSERETEEILRRDAAGQSGGGLSAEQEATVSALEAIGRADMAESIREQGAELPVLMKDRTFHYLPYSFKGSKLEKHTLEHLLQWDVFQRRDDLQVFFNGERRGQAALSGFRIDCYQKPNGRWRRVGYYTPDFLVAQRGEDGQFRRILIVETKGAGFADQATFLLRREFVEGWFKETNNAHDDTPTFDFLQLSDGEDEATRLTRLRTCIETFFTTETAPS